MWIYNASISDTCLQSKVLPVLFIMISQRHFDKNSIYPNLICSLIFWLSKSHIFKVHIWSFITVYCIQAISYFTRQYWINLSWKSSITRFVQRRITLICKSCCYDLVFIWEKFRELKSFEPIELQVKYTNVFIVRICIQILCILYSKHFSVQVTFFGFIEISDSRMFLQFIEMELKNYPWKHNLSRMFSRYIVIENTFNISITPE